MNILLNSAVAGFLGSPIFMFILIIAIMYFMMIRPQRKRQKELDNFRNGSQSQYRKVSSHESSLPPLILTPLPALNP